MKITSATVQPSDFSEHLFWDVDRNLLDFEKSKRWIIARVLEYGLMKDWIMLTEVYGLRLIKEEIVSIRSLDDVTLSFLCSLFDLKKEDFRCYTLRQSNPNFWSY